MEQCQKKRIKFICLKCNKVFDRAKRLEDHKNKPSCGTVCTKCNHKFSTRRRLEQHKKNANLIDCDMCKLKFCHQTDYNNHRRIVHMVNPLKCTSWNKIFQSKPRLEQHQENTSIIDCSICDLKFCHQTIYNNHLLLVVHQVNPLQCSICNKSFKSQQCLKDHKKNTSLIDLSSSWLQ